MEPAPSFSASEVRQDQSERIVNKRSSEDDNKGGESPTKRFRSESVPEASEASCQPRQSRSSLIARIKTLEAALTGMHSSFNNFVSSFVTFDFAHKYPQMTEDLLRTSYHFHRLCSGAHKGTEYNKQNVYRSTCKSASEPCLPIRQRDDTIRFECTVDGVRQERLYKLDPNDENVAIAQDLKSEANTDPLASFAQHSHQYTSMPTYGGYIPPYTGGL